MNLLSSLPSPSLSKAFACSHPFPQAFGCYCLVLAHQAYDLKPTKPTSVTGWSRKCTLLGQLGEPVVLEAVGLHAGQCVSFLSSEGPLRNYIAWIVKKEDEGEEAESG